MSLVGEKHLGADIFAGLAKAYDQAAEDPEAEREKYTEQYRETFLNPYAAAKAGYVDDVIEPRETRQYIIKALHALKDKAVSLPARKHGNIPL